MKEKGNFYPKKPTYWEFRAILEGFLETLNCAEAARAALTSSPAESALIRRESSNFPRQVTVSWVKNTLKRVEAKLYPSRDMYPSSLDYAISLPNKDASIRIIHSQEKPLEEYLIKIGSEPTMTLHFDDQGRFLFMGNPLRVSFSTQEETICRQLIEGFNPFSGQEARITDMSDPDRPGRITMPSLPPILSRYLERN